MMSKLIYLPWDWQKHLIRTSPLEQIRGIIGPCKYLKWDLEKKENSNSAGSKIAAASKIKCFVIIVNGFQPLTILTKRSILDVAAVLHPPLSNVKFLGKKNSHVKPNDIAK